MDGELTSQIRYKVWGEAPRELPLVVSTLHAALWRKEGDLRLRFSQADTVGVSLVESVQILSRTFVALNS